MAELEDDYRLIKNKVALAFKQELTNKLEQLSIDEIIKAITYDVETGIAVVRYDGADLQYDVDEIINYTVRKIEKIDVKGR